MVSSVSRLYSPFKTVYLPVSYSGNPAGVNGVPYRGVNGKHLGQEDEIEMALYRAGAIMVMQAFLVDIPSARSSYP